MGPFLKYYDLPETLDELNSEQNEIIVLIHKEEDRLKEAHEQKTKTLKKFYVLESTRDNRESEVNKLISKIKRELNMLKQTYDFLESNRWRYGDATKQVDVKSVGTGTSPVGMTPLPKQKSRLRSILKSLTKRRSASKPHAGGRKTRRQRARRAH
jgi:hypothetical protein